jgi:tetratricopeptide (TPR) repeat protein
MVDEAIAQFQKALQDPRLATQAHANLGRCFQAKELHDLAIREFEKTLSQIPDGNSPLAKDVTYALGETYAQKGDYDQARSTMEKILALDIGFRDVSQKVTEYSEKAQAAK